MARHEQPSENTRIVYLMRGLPSCGKSTTARLLAGDSGTICETDEYFWRQDQDGHRRFEFSESQLPAARQWNLTNYESALKGGVSPVIVDRGNGLNHETQNYVTLADQYGYSCELREPSSPWWHELRVLLKYRQFVDQRLFERWAMFLAEQSKATHRVPVSTISKWMAAWRTDLTVDEIRCYQ